MKKGKKVNSSGMGKADGLMLAAASAAAVTFNTGNLTPLFVFVLLPAAAG
jgi:hypothetical protein